MNIRNHPLLLAGIFTGLASLLHVGIICGGADWYRFFGAGEGMAILDESGSSYPAIVTASIAIMLALWATYAFSGAGLIKRLPYLKVVLLLISTIFLVRGVLGIPLVIWVDHPYLNELAGRMVFLLITSIVSLGLGALYIIGWNRMRSVV